MGRSSGLVGIRGDILLGWLFCWRKGRWSSMDDDLVPIYISLTYALGSRVKLV